MFRICFCNGGVHVGSSSDPGDDNLIVDGQAAMEEVF